MTRLICRGRADHRDHLSEVDGEPASVWGDLENFFSKVKILVLYEVDI